MAMTVTVTGSGPAPVVTALAVAVLTGAAATQNGVTASNGAVSGTPDLAVTPGSTGGYVYGAMLTYPATVAYTATAATTYTANTFDTAVTNCGYGILHSTAKTTASTPVTLGATAPGSITAGSIALAEVKASGTLAIDASTPAGVTGHAGASLVTASFTPPAGSLLVTGASGMDNTAGAIALAVTDSSGLSWTRLVLASGTGNGAAAVWVAVVPSGPAVSLVPPPVPQLFLPPGAQGPGRFTPWLPWEDARPQVAWNAVVIISATASGGGAVPGALVPGAAAPGTQAGGGAVLVTARAAFPAPVVTVTASPSPGTRPPGNCAWVRSSYY
jgi:hypothetical protein